MHLADGLLSPGVAAATSVVGAAGLGVAVRKLSRGGASPERLTVMMGILAAFVFAAQMVNFPVGPGVSGHLVGGVLAAVLLGPWAGMVVIAAVLIVQSLLFGDGGVTALGASFINMGLLGVLGGYAIYRPIRRELGDGPKGVIVGSMAGAWFSVILASGACALELAISGRAPVLPVLGWMLLVHAVIGVGEAVITGLVVRTVLAVRPDLIAPIDPESAVAVTPLARGTQTVLGGLGVALAVALFLAPLASSHPDGLESVGERLGFINEEVENHPPVVPAPIPEYEMPGVSSEFGLATAAAGVVGTLIVFGVGFGIAWGMGRTARPATEKVMVDAV